MSMQETQEKTPALPGLSLDVEAVRHEVVPVEAEVAPGMAPLEIEPELDETAAAYASAILEIDLGDADARAKMTAAVESMGADTQRRCAGKSRMLEQPIRALAAKSEDGGSVAKALVGLREEVESLDPGKVDFEAGWFTRAIGRIPGVGTPLKRYFTKFESAQTVIESIDRSLVEGAAQLKRDNITLEEDQKEMRALSDTLKQQIAVGQALDAKLARGAEREPEEDKRAFIESEIVFPLRQRIMDLQQQMAVNQQGVLAIEIVRRNNLELIRGVARARNVTMSALQVAVTVALALENQKIVLDKVTALNTTTSGLIASTASQLKTQGAQIHAQAASATLDIDALKSAFNDINEAIDSIGRFRRDALPAMERTIGELAELGRQGEASVRSMDERLAH